MTTGPAEQIAIGRALARLAIARAFRTTAQFAHRGGAAYTLAVRIVGDWNELIPDGRGVLTETRCLKIWVTANQTGLQPATADPEVILPGDTFVLSKYANRTYQVISLIHLDVGGRVYTLTLVETKRLGSGV